MNDLTDKQLLQATFEEVGTVKEEITEMKGKISQNQEETNDKLDKILEVMSEKFASQHKRIKKIEDHLGFATLM